MGLRGRKLKKVNPETLCPGSGAAGGPSPSPGVPVDPSPIRTKADATATCHTYLHPEVWMDCSSRGEPPSAPSAELAEGRARDL